MKILFVTGNSYLPQSHGGAKSSTDQLCHALLDRGHEVAVLCGLLNGGQLALRSRMKAKINGWLRGSKVSRDTGLGYPVWRAWAPWESVEYVTGMERPDLVAVMAVSTVRMALAAKLTRTPILIDLQDVEFDQHDGPFEALGDVPCVANSRFTAQRYRESFGVNPAVIYPVISRDKYHTPTTRENVTLINPVPRKGSDLALQIARLCPEIPFSFVEGWRLSAEKRRDLARQLADLPNVTFSPSQDDMRKVYGKCRILLAPSVWEEAFGRVVTEAQINGIPVVASTRGGLPEAVGEGGVLLAPDGPVTEWVTAIRELWSNDGYYTRLSAAALLHSSQPEFTFDSQVDAWERAMIAARGQ